MCWRFRKGAALRLAAALLLVAGLIPTSLAAAGPKAPTGMPFSLSSESSDRGIRVNDVGQVLYGSLLFTSRDDRSPVRIGGMGTAINNLGQVAGYMATGSGIHAFLRSQAGVVTDLGTLGGLHSWAYGMSDAGHVVGVSNLADGSSHAFLWTAADGMIDLGTLGGTGSVANAVNSSGQVAGWAATSDNRQRAFVWTMSGGMVDLGLLAPGPAFQTFSTAEDINDSGLVVGVSHAPTGNPASPVTTRAFVWTAGSGMTPISTGANGERVAAVNNVGQVIGSTSGSGPDELFMWSVSTGVVQLSRGDYQGSGFFETRSARVDDINNQGLIVGIGTIRYDRGFPPPPTITAGLFWQFSWEDLLVDLGPSYGLWMLGERGTTWHIVHGQKPRATATGDLDGNGQSDVIVDFGPGTGIWLWLNHTTWSLVTPMSAVAMTVGPDSWSLNKAVVFLAIAGSGTWRFARDEEPQWRQLSPNTAQLMTTCEGKLAASFTGFGVWTAAPNWRRLHDRDATLLTCRASGAGGLLIGFAGAGLWSYDDRTHPLYNPSDFTASRWRQVHPFDVRHVAAGDFDSRGTDDLVIDFGPPNGLWVFTNHSTWTPLHTFPAFDVTMADLDGRFGDEVVVNFGPPWGLWTYAPQSGWQLRHDFQIYSIGSGVLH